MRVLITGGGGFLGRYIVGQSLAQGDEVRVFSRGDYPELKALGAEVIRGDIRNQTQIKDACRSIDVVFHTASLPGISVWRQPFYEINVVGTQNVLTACCECGVNKLVYTSSPSVTDGGQQQCGVDETTTYPNKYLAWYPETKAIAERLVLAANGTKLASGEQFATCALRPRLIWGPGDTHLIPRLLERAKAGLLAQVGDGTNVLDITYVENAASAHLAAAAVLTPHGPVAGNAYYISQGEPVNCWEWINTVLKMVDLPPIRKRVSFNAAWRTGFCLEMTYRLLGRTDEPPMTRFLATQLAQSYWFNIDRAKNDFGYRPLISTEEGLQLLVNDVKRG